MTTTIADKPIALVTGGSGGIGAAISAHLARAGATVAVGYRTNKTAAEATCGAIQAEAGNAFPLALDVTDPTSVETAFDQLESAHGGARILVAANGSPRDRLAVRMGEEDWEQVIEVNLTGTARVVRRALRPMIRARRGRIVLISSVVAATGSAGQSNYAAAKAGLVGLARSTAREVATRNVTVNVIEPGPIATPMTDALSDARRDELAALVPMARFGHSDDVAAAAAFYASDAAGYITGTVLGVDGGLGMGR